MTIPIGLLIIGGLVLFYAGLAVCALLTNSKVNDLEERLAIERALNADMLTKKRLAETEQSREE